MARRPTSTRKRSASPSPGVGEIALEVQKRNDINGAPAREQSARAPVMEQLLTFVIGRNEYGISILRVREIAEYRQLTPVPMRPSWMPGVMNLRGTVVPVVDLAAKLGLGTTAISRFTCLIIIDLELDGERTVVAVMVDSVRRVVDVAATDIQEAPPFGMTFDIVPGMVRVDGELIILLDVTAIVSESELTGAAELLPALREAAEAAEASNASG
jgi:purine-binding chemotaxis protein CheW